MPQFDALTLAGVIERQALSQPDLRVLTVEGAGVRADEIRTFADLWSRARALASGLQERGMVKGDRLATLLANHAEFVDLMVACSLLGVVLVPIDPRTRGEKLVFMLDSVGCRGVVAADYALAALQEKAPGYTLAVARSDFFFCADEAIVERCLEGLRRAGLGDGAPAGDGDQQGG